MSTLHDMLCGKTKQLKSWELHRRNSEREREEEREKERETETDTEREREWRLQGHDVGDKTTTSFLVGFLLVIVFTQITSPFLEQNIAFF